MHVLLQQYLLQNLLFTTSIIVAVKHNLITQSTKVTLVPVGTSFHQVMLQHHILAVPFGHWFSAREVALIFWKMLLTE